MPENDSEYFSKEGLQKLKEELAERKTKVRKEIADRLEYAKSLGDLSENSEYQEAKESQMMNESRIAEVEDIIRRAVIVEAQVHGDMVSIGAEVVIQNEAGAQMTYTIVGSQEASPQESKISNESPLGRALLGKKKGEEFVVLVPKGEMRYKIIDIL
jgi:transcription elongation factor GreA